MKTKTMVMIGTIAAIGIILFFFYSQSGKIPSYGEAYVESQGWHAKKVISEREKIESADNETVTANLLKLTGIDLYKEQEVYQERYRLKEKCHQENVDVVVLTDTNKEVIGGYLIKTETDPGTIKMKPYDKSCGKEN